MVVPSLYEAIAVAHVAWWCAEHRSNYRPFTRILFTPFPVQKMNGKMLTEWCRIYDDISVNGVALRAIRQSSDEQKRYCVKQISRY